MTSYDVLDRRDGGTVLCVGATEPDPDCADRGGWLSYTEKLFVLGNKLVHEFEVDDVWEERMGELPEPWGSIDSKEDGLAFVDSAIAHLEQQLNSLRVFRAKVEATTECVDNYKPPVHDEDDEESDE